MNWLAERIKPILIVSGALTCTMFLALVAPQAALRTTFGATLDGPVADMVVRNWGALIGLVGVLLIHAAFVPASRPPVLALGIASKLVFIGLVVSHGAPYVERAAVPLVADTLMIVAFAAYFLRDR
jgi:hypothetical protein